MSPITLHYFPKVDHSFSWDGKAEHLAENSIAYLSAP
jgi:hypothetical protein